MSKQQPRDKGDSGTGPVNPPSPPSLTQHSTFKVFTQPAYRQVESISRRVQLFVCGCVFVHLTFGMFRSQPLALGTNKYFKYDEDEDEVEDEIEDAC